MNLGKLFELFLRVLIVLDNSELSPGYDRPAMSVTGSENLSKFASISH